MSESRTQALRDAGFRGKIDVEAPLAPLTTWRIGGPAELLVSPADADDLRTVVAWAAEQKLPSRVLGNGSNLLVHDDGVRGVVIRLRRVLDEVRFDGRRCVAGAGASFPAVARQAASRGLGGLEFGAGIPGTIGGAIVMNAGWHEFEIGNLADRVDSLDPAGHLHRRPTADCRFAYRRSRFRGGREIVVAAELILAPGNATEISERLEHFASSRKQNQPTELPSCGSVFLKPPGDFAGRLIEQAGLKGERVGPVEVSTKHANFFVNHGGARCDQVLELVERVERAVEAEFGVHLVREFELWS